MNRLRDVPRRLSVRPAAWLLIGVASFAALVLSTSGPPAPTPNPPGTFAFGAFGDAPYYPWEDWRYPLMLQDMDGTTSRFPFMSATFSGVRAAMIGTSGAYAGSTA